MSDNGQDELELARQALANACLRQPMNPQTAGISAYVNSIMASARVTAICSFLLEPRNETWSAAEALEAAMLKALREATAAIEEQTAKVSRIQVADTVPAGIIKSNLLKAN